MEHEKKSRKRYWLIVIAVLCIAAGLAIYELSAHRLTYSKNDVVIGEGCNGVGSTYIVVYPNGSGYLLEGNKLSCYSVPPTPGKKHSFKANFFNYASLVSAITADEHIQTKSCSTTAAFLEVRYGSYDNKDLGCYGTARNNGPADNPGTLKIDNLVDEISNIQVKAYNASGINL